MNLVARLNETRRQEAVDAIAEVALGLFARDGYDATSVESIAKAAGCSPRTFYRYFRTKEDVMFHDLPEAFDGLAERLGTHLRAGTGRWEAVCATLLELIGRFERTEDGIAARRMTLWMAEPPLRTRYMQYVLDAEQAISDCLHRHAGTGPREEDAPELIAATAVGAYRMTVVSHGPAGELTGHLRDALDRVGAGVARL
jgi:AcrR family transcriptional regulator